MKKFILISLFGLFFGQKEKKIADSVSFVILDKIQYLDNE